MSRLRVTLAALAVGATALVHPAGAGAVGRPAVPAVPDVPADTLAIAAHLGVPVAEALRRLDLQDDAGRLEETVQRRWPATFGGLWIDHAAGGVVRVAFTERAAENVAEAARGFAYPDALRAVTVARPLRELVARQRRMIDDRELVKAGRLAVPGVRGAGYDLDIDVPANVVVVRMPRVTPAAVAGFRSRYGADVVLREAGLIEPDACTSSACRFSIRSGVGTASTSGSHTCSTAFSVYDWNSTRFTLSAAHCSGTDRYHEGTKYGSVVQQQQQDKVDAERISVNSNGFYAGGWILVNSGEQARQVTTWGTYSTLAIGTAICKTGITTNNTCGTVQTKNEAPTGYVTGANSFIGSDMCTGGGDSGAGVYTSGQAQGIHSGSNSSTTPCTNSSFRSVFGHIEFALSALSVSNTVAGNAEPTPSFSSVGGARNLQRTVTATFSKPVLCSTVGTADFTILVNNSVNNPVSSVTCANDSNRTVTITATNNFTVGSTLYVTAKPIITDPGGNQLSQTALTTVVAA